MLFRYQRPQSCVLDGLVQDAKETLAVGIILEDVFAVVAATSYMVYGAFVLDAQGASHGGSMAEGGLDVNGKDLTPFGVMGWAFALDREPSNEWPISVCGDDTDCDHGF